MIKKLRRRFIGIAMLSVSLVLIFIIGAIDVANHLQTREKINQRLDIVEGIVIRDEYKDVPSQEGQGKFPNLQQEYRNAKPIKDKPNREAEFDTRFFMVSFSDEGMVDSVNMSYISSIEESEAVALASKMYEANKEEGFYDYFAYKSTTLSDGSVQYVFLDCERELEAERQYILNGLGISFLGLLMVLVLVVILSGKIMRPVIESYEKQKRFITDASHEIKTPLTIIDANTEILEMMHGEDEWTKSNRKQIKRLTSLTEKLVFLSRMDEENASYMDITDFNLSEAVSDTADSYHSLAAAKEKTLLIDVENSVNYRGDEGQIRQMVSLLLDNAMKYSDEKGTIGVKLSMSGKTKTITIWNTTEPMKPGKYDELFERFYRLDESRNSKTGGFGIGLSVVYAIVLAHKGKITAKNEDGTTMKMVITL